MVRGRIVEVVSVGPWAFLRLCVRWSVRCLCSMIGGWAVKVQWSEDWFAEVICSVVCELVVKVESGC